MGRKDTKKKKTDDNDSDNVEVDLSGAEGLVGDEERLTSEAPSSSTLSSSQSDITHRRTVHSGITPAFQVSYSLLFTTVITLYF